MKKQRVLVVCLDAFDAATAEMMMKEGHLSKLAKLKKESANFPLEHGEGGKAKYTGLTMEHFSSGQTPDTAEKWSVISFDPKKFEASQNYATLRPFFADMDANVVVMDQPYFDLEGYTNMKGVVGWGGHDTGVNPYCYPESLADELAEKFDPPNARSDLNCMVYPSVEQTREMAEELTKSVHTRTDIAEWMFAERFPDWDVALIAYGETHDAIELFYHGVDPDHHLANIPSAEPARKGVYDVYEAVSDSIDRLANKFPDAALVIFSMHGMGANDTDLMTMLFLPEFMYRYNFRKPFFRSRADWKSTDMPCLQPGEAWEFAVKSQMQRPLPDRLRRLPQRLKDTVWNLTHKPPPAEEDSETEYRFESVPNAPRVEDIGWMPSVQYSPYWPKMKAFAVPGYFDGRVRVNLKGREKYGIVDPSDYESLLDDIEAELRATVDIRTGKPVIKEIIRPANGDPMSVGSTQADIKIIWNGSPTGFRNSSLGDIGPAPVRRVGGHSGGDGTMLIKAPELTPGDYDRVSSFDVAPTIIELMGKVRPNYVDGVSVIDKIKASEVV